MDADADNANNEKQPLPMAGGDEKAPATGQNAHPGNTSHAHEGGASHTHEGGSTQHSHGAAPSGQRTMRPPTQLREPNTILVGKKSVMAYVLAVVSQFNNGSPFVKLKARGKIISRAVDVAEIVRHRFINSAHAKEIKISTEDLQSEDGTMSKVSSIEITLVK